MKTPLEKLLSQVVKTTNTLRKNYGALRDLEDLQDAFTNYEIATPIKEGKRDSQYKEDSNHTTEDVIARILSEFHGEKEYIIQSNQYEGHPDKFFFKVIEKDAKEESYPENYEDPYPENYEESYPENYEELMEDWEIQFAAKSDSARKSRSGR